MSNNTTFVCLVSYCYLSYLGSETEKHVHSSTFNVVTLSAAVIVAILSPVAMAGNALILAAIWRNPSLRTPSYILLAGLAFTDFGTGLFTQPVYVANELSHFKLIDRKESHRMIMAGATNIFAVYFSSTTVLIITFMSIERWLNMTRRSLVTVPRTCIIIAVLTAVPAPLAVYQVISIVNGARLENLFENSTFLTLLVFCITVTSVAYSKLFRIIRRHQQQIQANEVSHNFGQPSIDFAKYKKSVFSILYILVAFYIGYLPISISFALFLVSSTSITEFNLLFFNVSMAFLFLSSSLNPLLYLWRMKDIRNEVIKLVKRIFCKGN